MSPILKAWTGRTRYQPERQGQEALIGRKLYALFHQAQMQDIREVVPS